MPTQITNKQVKIIDTVNFNNQSIENAIIDCSKNTINNLDITKNLVDAGITKTTSHDSMIDLAQEIESKHFSIGTTLFGEIENTGMPFIGNAEVKVDILDQKDDGDQVILFTLYSTNVAPYEWEWRYYLTDTVNWIPKAIPTNDYTSNSQTTVPTSYALNDGLSNLQIQIGGISNNIITITNDIITINNDIITINNDIITINNNIQTLDNNIVILDNTIEGISTEIDNITNSILQINNILENKQNTLIAGNGIIIDNNVISCTSSTTEKDIINLTSESPITNVTLDSNNTYTLVCNNEVTTLNIHINEPEDRNINNSTLLHCYIGNSNIIINYGTDTFFNNDEQPIIDSYGYYDIIWVYNNLLSKWVCNLTLVNISEYSYYRNLTVNALDYGYYEDESSHEIEFGNMYIENVSGAVIQSLNANNDIFISISNDNGIVNILKEYNSITSLTGIYTNINTNSNGVLISSPFVQPEYQNSMVEVNVENLSEYNNIIGYVDYDEKDCVVYTPYYDSTNNQWINFSNNILVHTDYSSIIYITGGLSEPINGNYYSFINPNTVIQFCESALITIDNDTLNPYNTNSIIIPDNCVIKFQEGMIYTDANIVIHSNSRVNINRTDFNCEKFYIGLNDSSVNIHVYCKDMWSSLINQTYINGVNSVVSFTYSEIYGENFVINGENSYISFVNSVIDMQLFAAGNTLVTLNFENAQYNGNLLTVENYNSILQPDTYFYNANIIIDGIQVQTIE